MNDDHRRRSRHTKRDKSAWQTKPKERWACHKSAGRRASHLKIMATLRVPRSSMRDSAPAARAARTQRGRLLRIASHGDSCHSTSLNMVMLFAQTLTWSNINQARHGQKLCRARRTCAPVEVELQVQVEHVGQGVVGQPPPGSLHTGREGGREGARSSLMAQLVVNISSALSIRARIQRRLANSAEFQAARCTDQRPAAGRSSLPQREG